MNIIAGPQGSDPDPMVVVYQMGVAIRRLLILVDGRKSAAKFASSALKDADAMLQRRRAGSRRP